MFGISTAELVVVIMVILAIIGWRYLPGGRVD